MKQILQDMKSGKTLVSEVARPVARDGQVLIATSKTLVSSGTERMLVEFGKAGLLGKARQQPDKVRMVLQKMRTDGLVPTIEAVLNKLDQPLPLGYCNVGEVVEIGRGAKGFNVGDRVVSNGKHAEVVSSPVNLCAKVPDTVSDEEAAMTVLGAIGLQGIRLAEPTLGECVVVSGLGLIGLMTVQILRANGCRVLGLDFDKQKLELARSFGADVVDLGTQPDPVDAAMKFSRGRGVDAVLVTAATRSSEPMHHAAKMCRKRGRIVLVGVTGLELSRADFYEKELSFQVSCSYGPGRYEKDYEDSGFDYPPGFVRWTEQRNFEAVLDLMASNQLNAKPLITDRFTIDDASEAYELVVDGGPSLGIVIDYPDSAASLSKRVVPVNPRSTETGGGAVNVAFVGAGNYATAVLAPAFKSEGANLKSVVSMSGVSGMHAARKFGFSESSTDTDAVLADDSINAVVISTRHDSHASLVSAALAAGKHVFVEKPLALTYGELASIETAWTNTRNDRILTVGFNRRFAPHVVKLKELLDSSTGPHAMVMTVNAGRIPTDHWTQDLSIGGGRILGEACHFIDLLRHLAGASVAHSDVVSTDAVSGDTVSINLAFENGSIGSIHYIATGGKSFPKERLEVFSGGGVLQLDNFRSLRGFDWPGFRSMGGWKQDKGQSACASAFIECVRRGGSPPIPIDELFEVGRLSIELAEAGRG